MNPVDQLKSVLCDQNGKCCIAGSEEDRAIVDRALQALAEQPVPVHEMTPEMMRKVQIQSELGAYAAANLSNAYELFAEFWRVAMSAAPQPAQPTGDYCNTIEQALTRLQKQCADLEAQVAAQPEQEPVAALLLQSKKNHERNFGPSAVADWIYSDLLELLDTEPPKRQPLTNCRQCGGPDNVLCGGQCKTVGIGAKP